MKILKYVISLCFIISTPIYAMPSIEEAKQRLREQIRINKKLGNRILKQQHLLCYICQTGEYPKRVLDLNKFKPNLQSCKDIFPKKKFVLSSNTSHKFHKFHVQKKMFGDVTVFYMTRKKTSYESLLTEYKGPYKAISIKTDLLSCTETET